MYVPHRAKQEVDVGSQAAAPPSGRRGMFHAKSFEEYAATRVMPARISRARKLMQVHAALLGRMEQGHDRRLCRDHWLYALGLRARPFYHAGVEWKFWPGPRTKRLT